MNYYFVSDNHFHHAKIIRYSNRAFSSVEEMNEVMIENWNKLVKDNDTIWNLGDFSFANLEQTKKTFSRLNGIKNIILGNHDKVIDENKSKFSFNIIDRYREIKIGNQLIVLNHYGQRVWRNSHHSSFHLYGHSHGSLPPYGKSVDVGVDCKEITSEYRPVHYDEVKAYLDKRDFIKVDHHD